MNYRLKNLSDYDMTITVVVTRELKIRIAIAKWFFRLAAFVLRCGLDLKEEKLAK